MDSSHKVQFVNHGQIPRILRALWIASLQSNVLLPTCLIGGVGSGKTTAANKFGKFLENYFTNLDNNLPPFKTILFHAALVEGTDIGGFPYTELSEITGQRDLKYAMMDLLPFDTDQPALIILDEWDRAPIDVLNVGTELLQGGNIHGHQLSKNAYIIATMNGSADKHTNSLPDAIINRMCTIFVSSRTQDNLAAWHEFAIETGIDERIIGYKTFNQHAVAENPDYQELAFPTERAIDQLGAILKAVDIIKENSGDDGKDILLPIIAGMVGTATAIDILSYLDCFAELPNIDEILDDPTILTQHSILTNTAKLTAFISNVIKSASSIEASIKRLILIPFIPKEMGSWLLTTLKNKHSEIITSTEYKEAELSVKDI